MASAKDVIDLFITEDPERARTLAAQLHQLNQERQEAEAAIVREILERCESEPVRDDQFALVFSSPGWHRGVVGIVASRIVERFHRPAFVLSEEDGEAQGSGRSIRPFHLLEALESMPDLFTRFGGHRQAAGVGLPSALVDEFRERLNHYAAERLTPEDLKPSLHLDGFIAFSDVTEDSAMEILQLAPFGFGNPSPVFGVCGVEVSGPAEVWNDKHLNVRLRQNGRSLRIKAWNFASRAAEFAPGTVLDAAICFEADKYSAARGYASWCVELKDARPAGAAAAG